MTTSDERETCYRCKQPIIPNGSGKLWIGPGGLATCPGGTWAHRPAPVELYPEHDKLAAVAVETNAAYEFIQWLGERRIVLHQLQRSNVNWCDVPRSIGELLAEWKGIDMAKVEQEKRAMIAAMRGLDA